MAVARAATDCNAQVKVAQKRGDTFDEEPFILHLFVRQKMKGLTIRE